MARTFQAFKKATAANLITAVNTYLATLTNPIIRGFWPQISSDQHRLGNPYAVTIETDSGGSAIATPWLLSIIEANDLPDFITAVQTFETAQLVSGWCTAARLLFTDVGGKSTLYSGLNLYNASAGASANFLPL